MMARSPQPVACSPRKRSHAGSVPTHPAVMFAICMALAGAMTKAQQSPPASPPPPPDLLATSCRCSSRTVCGVIAPRRRRGTDPRYARGPAAGGRHGAAIVAGDAEKSPLVGMMEGRVEPRMPPKSVMRPEDIAVVRAWIDAGAKESPGAALTLEERVPRITPAHGLSPAVHSLAWSVDGRTLLVPGYRDVRRVDVASAAAPAARPRAHRRRARRVESATPRCAAPARSAAPSISCAASRDRPTAGGSPAPAAFPARPVKSWSGTPTPATRAFALRGHRDYVYDAAFNHRSTRLATCSYDRTVRIWDLDTGRAIRVLREHTEAVYAVAFSADETGWRRAPAIARSSCGTCAPASGWSRSPIPSTSCSTLDFDPRPAASERRRRRQDHSHLDLRRRARQLRTSRRARAACASRPRWCRRRWRTARRFCASPTRPTADGSPRRPPTASSRSGIRGRWTEVRTLERQPDWAQGLAWSPDGARLAVGRFDGSVAIYDVTIGPQSGRTIRGPPTKAATTEAMRRAARSRRRTRNGSVRQNIRP